MGMTKWEYKICSAQGEDDLEKILKDLGQLSWELVHLETVQSAMAFNLVFKRPIYEKSQGKEAEKGKSDEFRRKINENSVIREGNQPETGDEEDAKKGS